MKKTKRLLIAFLIAMACCLCVLAVACEKRYTVSFETNGGATLSEVKVADGETCELPSPEKAGYVFEGWYLTDSFSGDSVTSLTPSENTTVYAKWSKLYTVTLSVGSGTLSTSAISLKAGENVYSAVKDLVPTYADHQFAAWYVETTALSNTYKMPENDITLTAKYKVAYTVEIYMQKSGSDEYEQSEKVVGYDYVGATVSPEKTYTGFVETDNEQTVSSLTLGENAGSNVLKLYFNRQVFTLTFNANYPDGKTETITKSVVYGEEEEVLSDLTFEGYVLLGWSTTASGAVEYASNYIQSCVYGATDIPENAKVKPERNVILYAVWQKGLTDMFGCGDILYFFGDTIYMNRGGVFFAGSYFEKNNSFEFIVAGNEKNIISGIILSETQYCYYNTKRANTSAYQYVLGKGMNKNVYFLLDGYDGLTLYENVNNSILESSGKVVVDENNLYNVTFDKSDNNRVGEKWTMIVGKINVNENDGTGNYKQVQYDVFQVKIEDEVALGELRRLTVSDGQLMCYKSGYYSITLDGFGNAVQVYNGQKSYYKYILTDDILALYNEKGSLVQKYKVTDAYKDQFGAITYAEYKATEPLTDKNGATITTDGMFTATYKDGETEISGFYTLTSTELGNYIFTFQTENGIEKVLVTFETVTVEKEDGTSGEEQVYVFTRKPADYAEYIFSNDSGYKYAPYFVLEDGTVTIYGYTTDKKFLKTAFGTYQYNNETNLYTLTVTEHFEAEVITSTVDYSQIKSVVFAVDNAELGKYNVNYWISMTDINDVTTEYATVYTSGEDVKIIAYGPYAQLTLDGKTYIGTVSISDSKLSETGKILVFTLANGNALNAEYNPQDNTFVMYTSSVFTGYRLLPNGTVGEKETLFFNGKGGATYTDAEGVVTSGTISSTEGDQTLSGLQVYTFTSENLTFQYFIVSASQNYYFAIYSPDFANEYESDDGILYIDGCGFYAKYTNPYGVDFEGMYAIAEDGAIVFYYRTARLYFDLTENNGFTVRGSEYGTYLLVDNQNVGNTILNLDGYNKVEVTVFGTDEEGNTVTNVVDTTTYTLDGKAIEFTYTDGNKTYTIKGYLSLYTMSGTNYNAVVIEHKEVKTTYVNSKDWSILILDGIGSAEKHDTEGNVEAGKYILITNNMLYYVNNDGSDACIYRYDAEKGEAQLAKFASRSYYTEDFEALVFSPYGFAIFGGTDRYYYDIDEEDNVSIFKYDPSNWSANEYGFISQDFGKFTPTKDYDGKHYIMTSGYAVMFKRNAENANLYPISTQTVTDLVFTPSGSNELNGVKGNITIGDRVYSCNVYRSLLADGTYETYALVSIKTSTTNLVYVVYLELNYAGEDEESGLTLSSFKVVGLERILLSAVSYEYYIYNMFSAMFGGGQIANTFGMMQVICEYDEQGEMTGQYLSALFLKDSKAVNIYGENAFYLDMELLTLEQDGDAINVVATAEQDGYTYMLYLTFGSASGTQIYTVNAFTVVQNVESEDGYVLTFEVMLINNNKNLPIGSIYSMQLGKQDGEEITVIDYKYRYFDSNNNLCLVALNYDENGTVLGGKQYVLTLQYAETDESEEAPQTVLKELNGMTVAGYVVSAYYTEDGKSYVLMASDKAVLYSENGTVYVVGECTYDAESGTYTFTIGNQSYTLKIAEGKAVVEKISQEIPEEETEDNGEGEN